MIVAEQADMNPPLLATALIMLCALRSFAQESATSPTAARPTNALLVAEQLEQQRIWTPKNHCMSTDIIHFRDHWLCSFQDSFHLIGQRRIHVIASEDGKSWKSVGQLAGDRTCSPFAARRNEEIMLYSATNEGDVNAEDRPLGWSSRDGINWTQAKLDIAGDRLLGRMVWHQDKWVGICKDSRTQVQGQMSLVSSSDGKAFEELVPELLASNGYYGPSIVFSTEGVAYCLVGHSDTSKTPRLFTVLGSAESPYRRWTWKELDTVLVGPTMIQLPDGSLLIAGRKKDHTTFPDLSPITLWSLDPESVKLTELLVLPSGTNIFTCGSPGLAWHDGHVWISYNSSHELNHSTSDTVIYLAKIRITESANGRER